MNARLAVVTGGSSGIGLETARGLLRRGFERVAIIGRDEARLARAAASLGPGALPLRADFSSLDQVRACAADVNQDGRLDLVTANYGKNGLFLNRGGGRFEVPANSSFTMKVATPVDYCCHFVK